MPVALIFLLAGLLTDTPRAGTAIQNGVCVSADENDDVPKRTVAIIYFRSRNQCWHLFFLFRAAIIEINTAIVSLCRSAKTFRVRFFSAAVAVRSVVVILFDGGTPFDWLRRTKTKWNGALSRRSKWSIQCKRLYDRAINISNKVNKIFIIITIWLVPVAPLPTTMTAAAAAAAACNRLPAVICAFNDVFCVTVFRYWLRSLCYTIARTHRKLWPAQRNCRTILKRIHSWENGRVVVAHAKPPLVPSTIRSLQSMYHIVCCEFLIYLLFGKLHSIFLHACTHDMLQFAVLNQSVAFR